MEKITHLAQIKNREWQYVGTCGHQANCGLVQFSAIPPAVHHCISTKIEEVSCAECADHYAEQHYIMQDAKFTLNGLYGKAVQNTAKQADLDAAFKLVEAKDKEIAKLEREAKRNAERLSKARAMRNLAKDESNRYYRDLMRIAMMNTGLNTENAQLKRENVELSNQKERLEVKNGNLRDKLHEIWRVIN